jgi:hypothetical protein
MSEDLCRKSSFSKYGTNTIISISVPADMPITKKADNLEWFVAANIDELVDCDVKDNVDTYPILLDEGSEPSPDLSELDSSSPLTSSYRDRSHRVVIRREFSKTAPLQRGKQSVDTNLHGSITCEEDITLNDRRSAAPSLSVSRLRNEITIARGNSGPNRDNAKELRTNTVVDQLVPEIQECPVQQEIQECPVQQAKKAWMSYLRLNDSIITDIFAGQLQSTIRCSICHYK